MDHTQTELELINVTKKFGDVVAADAVSFQVKVGEFFFLLGPSGCGKTTTLRLIGGLEKADEGIIKIKGDVVNAVPPYKRPTATVFQNWALFPHKSVYDNIAFGLRMKKVPKGEIRKKVKEFLDLARLSGYENRMPSQLSGGEQQRVALARALITNPALLLLDEPLSNLDLRLRQQMRTEIKQIQRQTGITTIFVTHDQTEAMSMADRIAVMVDGRIEQIGTAIQMYENPKSEFVAGFIGETNFFCGKVSSIKGTKAIIKTNSGLPLIIQNETNLAEGDKVAISIRPEDVEIFKGKGVPRENTFIGKIYQKAYLGSYARYHIRLDNENTIFVDKKIISGARERMYAIGDKINVGWKIEDCLCFSRD